MGLNRTTLYYKPKGESAENLKMMEMMDKYYLDHPTAGVLTMVNMLILAGMTVGAKRVRRLMRKMGLMAIYPQKCLSKGGKPEYFHPYLLRHLGIDHPNQVWSTDISYIPMKGGFMYLYAIIDVYSRFIVGWRLSNTLSANNCYELIINSDVIIVNFILTGQFCLEVRSYSNIKLKGQRCITLEIELFLLSTWQRLT